MTKEEIKKLITKIVSDKNGLKATELPVIMIDNEHFRTNSDEELNIPSLIEELVKSGDLVEVEYCLPNLSYRIKSFLLPAKTEVYLNQ